MKAGQWDNKLKQVVIRDVPIPEPGPGQVLVKIKSASLCHSDLMHFNRFNEEPVTLGHEGAGVIEKIHPSVEGKGFQVGDAVGCGYFLGCCYECEGCDTHQLFCATGNQKLQGTVVDGFFAEYAIEDWQNLAKLPPTTDLAKAAPIFCAGITAFHSVDSCELKPGQWLAVIGCGGLGQLACQYGKAMGLKVLGVDINDATLEVFKGQGADAIFNSRTNKSYVDELKKLTNGGVHATAVFSDADAAYAGAPAIVRVNGLIMCVGLPKNSLSWVSALDLCIGKYRIKGESTSIPKRMKKAVDFTVEHNIIPEVEFRPLEDLPKMFDEMHQLKATKRMVVTF